MKFDILDPIQGESRSSAPKLGNFKFYLAPKMDDDDTDQMHESNADEMQTDGLPTSKHEASVKPEGFIDD